MLVLVACARTHVQHAAVTDVDLATLAPGVTAGELPNGLRYLIIADTDYTRRIAWSVEAGPLQEADNEVGVAKVLGEVLSRGSGPVVQVGNDRTGGDVIDDNVEHGLASARRWFETPPTREALSEVQQVNRGDGIFGTRDRARWSGTRLERHSRWPSAAVVAHIDLAMLEHFRRRWYIPRRTTLVVQGPWPRARIVDAITRAFSSLEDRPVPPEPPLREGARGTFTGRGDNSVVMSFLFDDPAPRTLLEMRDQERRYLFERAVELRLRRATTPWGPRSPQTLVHDGLRLSARVVSFALELETPLNKPIAAAVLAREIERIHRFGFDRDELREARTPTSPPPCALDEDAPRRYRCWSADTDGLDGAPPLPCEVEAPLRRALDASIGDDEINELRALLDPREAAIAATDERSPPDVAAITTAVHDALAAPIAPWSELPELLPNAPVPGTLVTETLTSDGVELVLGNGARAIFHRTDDNRISIRASSPGGTFAESDTDAAAWASVAPPVTVAGLGAHDGLMTRRILDHLGIELQVDVERRAERIVASAPHRSIEALFEAVNLAMRADRVDGYSAALHRERALDAKLPALASHVSPRVLVDLGLGSETTPTPDHALAIYRRRFGNAGDFVFEISAPMETDRARALIATYLASLPDDGRRETAAPFAPLAARIEVTEAAPAEDPCSDTLHWLAAPATRAPLDELRLWTIAVNALGDHVVAWGERQGTLGYALHLSQSRACGDTAAASEATIRDSVTALEQQAITSEQLDHIRLSYGRADIAPDVARTPEEIALADGITAADVARVLARFYVPAEILVVHTTR
jgi:hypothetical protein